MYSGITMEYCLEDTLHLQCSADEVILIEGATYGRMKLNRCVRINYGYIGCGRDVTELLAAKCSGRRSCDVVNLEALFAGSNACPGDLKAYLEATYTCLKGKR